MKKQLRIFLSLFTIVTCAQVFAEDFSHDVISAPLEKWTFISVPESRCANNSSTGIGVNPTNKSNKVLIYLEGGGGCWDSKTCADAFHVQNGNLNGFDSSNFDRVMNTGAPEYKPAIPAQHGYQGLWDRKDSNNPFVDYNYIYIPYCTADFHSGNSPNSAVTGLSHVGYKNMGHYLDILTATFGKTATNIVLSGSSAGGFGANWNYQRTKKAFAGIPVTLLDESGIPLDFTTKSGAPLFPKALQDSFNSAWNLDSTKPAASASIYLKDVFYSNAKVAYPQKIGLIASKLDPVFPLFLRDVGGVKDIWSLSIGLNELKQSYAVPGAPKNVMFYYMPLGIDHGYIHKPISEWPTEISNSPWDLKSFIIKLVQ